MYHSEKKQLKIRMGSFLFLFGFFSMTHGQILQRVNHLSGSQKINDITVDVTSKGQTAIMWDKKYCNGETGPYFIGYNTVDYSCSNGSYTFSFSPPVSEVKLNFTGLSYSDKYYEEMILYVNGEHYKIKEAGVMNSCEPLAILSPDGNVAGCNECSTSGWNDTRIKGPIYTLTVMDSVFKGEPAGALFALYIGYVSLEVDLGSKVRAYKKPSAAGESLIIEADSVDLKLVSIQNPKGEKTDYHSYSDFPYISINISEFAKGEEYTFEFKVNDMLISKKIIIW